MTTPQTPDPSDTPDRPDTVDATRTPDGPDTAEHAPDTPRPSDPSPVPDTAAHDLQPTWFEARPDEGRPDERPADATPAGTVVPRRPSGPHLPPVLLGIVCLAVAGLAIWQEVTDVSVDWGDIGPLGIVAIGALLVVLGLVGLLGSRRRDDVSG